MDNVLTTQAVVIDNGSGFIKAGFAGEDEPKAIFSSFVGRPKHTVVMPGGSLHKEFIIGPSSHEHRGLLKIRYPISHGIVDDWDDMERIWQYLYTEELKTQPEEHAVLLTEAPLNPRKHREEAARILFENFGVPAVFFSIQAVLSLYSTGRTTGVVLDSGDGVTHSVPIYEGFAMPNAIQRMDLAGRDVTEYFQLLLRKAGYAFSTSAEKEVVRIMKEQTTYVSMDVNKEPIETKEYTLPDGQKIQLGRERFQAPEILFNPDLIGEEYVGVHQLLVNSIRKTDLDLRKTLYSHILLAGGSTYFRDFPKRLVNETMHLAPQNMKIKIYAPENRKHATWIGGSILANLSTFKKICVTAKEYREDPDIIHKKSF